ncbi:MAG: DinB family protein [Candidatus Dormibacteraceae bacterium]
MELKEEMSAADAVLLMSSVPEHISDLAYGLTETRLRYRHGPAFPTLGALIAHLLDSGTKVDGLLRRAHLEGKTIADVRATIDPMHDQGGADKPLDAAADRHAGAGLERPLQEALEDFARVRRRTVDLLHGWGKTEWARTITDPHGGEMSLLEVCRLVAGHEMSHIAQLRNLIAMLPEPQDLGPARPIVQ